MEHHNFPRTPTSTRYNRRRKGQQRVNDSSDSSIENERWRNNYERVKDLLTESGDSNSSSNQSSSSTSYSSSQNENQRNHSDIPHSLSASSDSLLNANDQYLADELADYASGEQFEDLRRENVLQQLAYEQDDDYASEDDIIEYQNILEEVVNNGTQNELQKMLNDDEVGHVINARVNVSKPEIFLAVLKFSLIYTLPQSAIVDLFKMLNLFFSTSVLPESRYLINKLFNFEDNVNHHAICSNCKTYVKQFSREQDYRAHCNLCNIEFSLKGPIYTDFFTIINPEFEIAHYLKENWAHYQNVVEARAKNQNNINEFYNGLQYKLLRDSLPDDKKDKFVTATFNSDGSPIFESSTFSIWPIQIIINELPFKLRMSKPIVCGLWYGKNKPNMNIFLKPFVDRMNLLADEGIICNVRNEDHTIFIYTICSCDDSVARAPMQGLTQFNGYFGCNWCLHPGYYIATGRGGSVKYILMDDQIQDRNEADSLRHIQECVESGQSVYGFIKKSVLTQLNNFNIISGFVPDSMHLIDLGIAKQFLKFWFDTTNMPYSLTNAETDQIDNFLKTVKVPSKLLRYSRSIKDRQFWKAKELQNWVLYYSTIALSIIPKMRCYVEHWLYLVRAYYILLQDSITRDQIHEANHFINVFVALTEYYYSRSAMTFNIHQLTHLTQSVIDWGPLHFHSGYGFENGNGNIVKQVQAANGVIHQIARVIGMKKSDLMLKEFLLINNPYSTIIDYAKYLENRECTKTFRTDIGRYFGKIFSTPKRWIRELNLSDSAIVYKKLVKMECVLLSCDAVRLRSNNSFAKTVNGDFIQIVFFIVDILNGREYTVYKSVNVMNIFNNGTVNDFQIKKVVDVSQDLRALDTRTIDRICIHMNCNNKFYLCPVPNLYSY